MVDTFIQDKVNHRAYYKSASKIQSPEYNPYTGSLLVEAVIAHEGVYHYKDGVGTDADSGAEGEYVPREELEKESFLKSIAGIPFILNHNDVNASNFAFLSKGAVSDARYEDGKVYAAIRIIDKVVIEYIRNKIARGEDIDVSISYFINNREAQEGAFKGIKYSVVQRDLICEHLGLVEYGAMPMAKVQHTNNNKGENNMWGNQMNGVNPMDVMQIMQMMQSMNGGGGNDNKYSNKGVSTSNSSDVEEMLVKMSAMMEEMKKMHAEIMGVNKGKEGKEVAKKENAVSSEDEMTDEMSDKINNERKEYAVNMHKANVLCGIPFDTKKHPTNDKVIDAVAHKVSNNTVKDKTAAERNVWLEMTFSQKEKDKKTDDADKRDNAIQQDMNENTEHKLEGRELPIDISEVIS